MGGKIYLVVVWRRTDAKHSGGFSHARLAGKRAFSRHPRASSRTPIPSSAPTVPAKATFLSFSTATRRDSIHIHSESCVHPKRIDPQPIPNRRHHGLQNNRPLNARITPVSNVNTSSYVKKYSIFISLVRYGDSWCDSDTEAYGLI